MYLSRLRRPDESAVSFIVRITCFRLVPENEPFCIETSAITLYNSTVILERHPEIQKLSTAEKLALIAELWDDVSANPENVPVSPDHLAELDRRMAEYRRDPSQVTSWEAIKTRILGPATSR